MRTRFDHPGVEGEPFEVPDRHPVFILRPREGLARPDEAEIARAFEDPVGAPRLADAAKGARRVLILVDDATRTTRVHEALPSLSDELRLAGVKDERVTVLTAPGTHREMTREELEQKLSARFLRRWKVAQHRYLDGQQLARYGATRAGMPVVVNRLMEESDLRIGIGQVGAHPIMGYSGGAKIVLPGICGYESEAWTHWEATRHPLRNLMGVMENPIRHAIEEGARMTGLDAVLNVATGPRGNIHRAAYGDLVLAQRRCARVAYALHGAHLDAPVDVVITDAIPADRDLWQSAKGLYTASLAVKEGGVIVLASPNPEGVADHHPNLLDLAGLPFESIVTRVESGREANVIGAAVAALIARIREQADVILVSSGIDADETRRLGFTPKPRMQPAVDEALRRAGPDATVAIFQRGGSLLPIVKSVNDAQTRLPEKSAEEKTRRMR